MMQTLPRLTATQIVHEMRTGYTKPCVFGCMDAKGLPAGEFVVKFGSGCRHDAGLLYELVAWELATLLGLPIPSAALVDIPVLLRRSAPTTSIVRSIANGHGVNFGTAYQRGVRTQPMRYRVPEALRPLAERIFFFDLLIENWDRTMDNPNLLFSGDRIVLIDHESAFVSARRPRDEELRWVDENYNGIVRHIFCPLVRNRSVDGEMVRDFFAPITRTWWEEVSAHIPTE